ncbi:MAG: YdcF family protein [Alphaproteobacteria bacterium]
MSRLVLLTGLAAIALWAGGLAFFASRLPAAPDPADRVGPLSDRDAIVVLTGGPDRIEAAIELLNRRDGKWLLVSGVGPGYDIGNVLSLTENGLPSDARIKLDRLATDTIGNARETRRWMDTHGLERLVLVTAAYHMPRSLYEFHAVMPGKAIVPYPVFPGGYDPAAWWDWKNTGRFIVSEFHKYLLARLRGGLSRHAPASPDRPASAPGNNLARSGAGS